MPTAPANVSYPTMEPGGEPGRAPQIDINIAGLMERARVGQAMEHLGQVGEQASNQLFETAQKFQQMRNNTEAANLNAENLQQRALDLEDFRTLQGQNASREALNGAIAKMEQHRQELLSRASNPYVANMVNTETRGTNARVAVQMADWSGSQVRKANDDALIGALKLEQNAVAQNPEDYDQYQHSVDKTNQISDQQSAQLGHSSAEAESVKALNISHLKEAYITGWIQKDVNRAKAIFNEERGTLDAQDIKQLEEKINTKFNVVMPRAVSQAVTRGFPANFTPKDQGIASQVQKPMQDIIHQMSRDDPNYRFGVTGLSRSTTTRDTGWVPAGATGIKYGESKPPPEAMRYAIGQFESSGRYSQDTPSVNKAGMPVHALGKYQVMDYNLHNWLAEAGMKDMTPEAFKKDPAAQDQLFDFKFGQYVEKYGTFNKAAAAWFAGEGGMNTTDVKDKFGTTVPRYLANVNAYLASWARTGTAQGPMREIDLRPIDPETGQYTTDPEAISELNAKMESAARTAGIPLEIGENGHYGLPRDYDVGSAPEAKEEPIQEMVDRGLAYARTVSDDPIYLHNVESEIRGAQTLRLQIKRQQETADHDLLWDGIMNVDGAGNSAKGLPQLLASDPERQAAFNRLPGHTQGRIMAEINAYNKSIETHTDQQFLTELYGLWSGNPQRFMQIDPADLADRLSQPDIRRIISMQRALAKQQPSYDPKVKRFLDIMGPKLSTREVAAFIDKSQNETDDRYHNYYQLLGAYQQILMDMPDQGKGLSTKDIQDIGDRLLKQQVLQQAVKGEWLRGAIPGLGVPFFDVPAIRGAPMVIAAGKKLSPEKREEIRQDLQTRRPNADILDQDIDIEAARREIGEIYRSRTGPQRLPGGP